MLLDYRETNITYNYRLYTPTYRPDRSEHSYAGYNSPKEMEMGG